MFLEKIKKLCKEKGETIGDFEVNMGFSRGAVYKRNKSLPNVGTAKKIADYFGVSIDWLMSEDDLPRDSASKKDGLTAKDERDIKQAIEDFKNRLSTAGVMYDGEPLDEESQAAVLAAVELAERTARIAAKEKFTPKKYKK